MDQVADHVYVGDYRDAQQEQRLKEAGISTVINLSKRPSPELDGIETIHLPLDDSWKNEQEAFNRAFETVLDNISEEKNVLIHCNMGVSRSVSVTAAAIAARDGMSLREALHQIEEQHPRANPHPRLVEQAEEALEQHG
ncbi:MAG: dual specificity protein phosphatase [Candidatus Nanohaloarchaea archaeon]|nr:dual specificity protein phosphatase [Candidatus Nanohaloarchaea archaeon]